jgi:oligosaccharide repeat unit polymerase
MSAASVISFLVCAAIVVSCFRKDADILSPFRIFGFVWSATIGLTDLKWSRFQTDWSGLSWVIVLLGPLSFIAGLFVLYVLNMGERHLSLAEMRERLRSTNVGEGRLFALTTIVFVLYALAYLLSFAIKGFLPLLSPGKGFVRTEWGVFGIGVLINSTPTIVFLTVLYHVVAGGQRRRKLILKLLTVISLVSYFLLLQRFQVVMGLIMSGTLVYYATNRLRLRVVLTSALAVVGFYFWISILRASALVHMIFYTTSRMKIPPQYALVTEPYMYLVMGSENLARSVERLDTFTYGFYTFDFLTALTGLKHWMTDYFHFVDTPFLVSGYNTYTAFWTFYRDFSLVGVTIVPLFLGACVGALYYRLRQGPTFRTLTAYSFVVFLMLFSFFIMPASFLWFFYNVCVLSVILAAVSGPVKAGIPRGSHANA